jgi:ribosome maturation factor RimP
MNGQVPKEVSDIMDAVAAESGLEVYHADTDGRVLRIQVDRPAGASLTTCADFARSLTARLNATNLARECRIEVSSPGVERRLYRAEDYIRVVGSRVRVRTRRGVMDGRLEATDDGTITLRHQVGAETRVEAIPITDIRDAQVRVSDRELFAAGAEQDCPTGRNR